MPYFVRCAVKMRSLSSPRFFFNNFESPIHTPEICSTSLQLPRPKNSSSRERETLQDNTVLLSDWNIHDSWRHNDTRALYQLSPRGIVRLLKNARQSGGIEFFPLEIAFISRVSFRKELAWKWVTSGLGQRVQRDLEWAEFSSISSGSKIGSALGLNTSRWNRGPFVGEAKAQGNICNRSCFS